MKKITIVNLVLCAMFAALSCILSLVTVPIGPVPINLIHISLFLAAGLLGWKYGLLSQLVFVFLGAVGLPVFSGFAGGFGVIAGPLGGFIVGYLACVVLTGLSICRFGRSVKALLLAMIPGAVVIYILGGAWFMYVTHSGLAAALTLCVLPFLPGDAAKIAVSAILVNRLWPAVRKINS